MDLFTYLMAKNGHNTSIHEDLFSYLLGKAQGGGGEIKTATGITINIPDAKKLVNFMMTKESTQDNIAYIDVGEWEQGTINSNGVNQESSNVVRTKDYIKVHPNVLYNISRSIYNSYMGFRFYDINNNYLGNHGTTGMVETNRPENRMVANDSNMTMTILNSNVAYLRMFDNSNNLNTIYTISTENTPSPDYPQEVKVVEGIVNLFDENTIYNYTFDTSTGKVIKRDDRNAYVASVKPNTTYVISRSVATSTSRIAYLENFGGGSSYNYINIINISTNLTYSFTTPENCNYVMFLVGADVATNLQLTESDQELPYVPYGSNYILYKQVGKNLFDKAKITGGILNADGTITTSSNMQVTDFIEISDNIPYYKTLSGSQRNKLYDKNKNAISTSSIADISNFSDAKSFTISDSNAKYIRFCITNENVDSLQLEVGSTATSYEAYKESIIPIPLNNNIIVGIGDYKDELKVDKSGNVFINKKTRKIELAIADMNNSDNYPGWKGQTQIKIDYPDVSGRALNIYTDYFCNIGTSGITINTSGNNSILYLSKAIFNLTETEWKEQYSNLVFILYYGLQTPELIDLQTTVDISLFEGVNNISNSEDGYMTIEYVSEEEA